jgi:hypothetical protein
MAMTRDEIYRDRGEMFGLASNSFKLVPDRSLELEWKLFKRVPFDDGPILSGMVGATVRSPRL